MKGYSYVSIMIAVISVMLTAVLLFAYWDEIVARVAKSAPRVFEGPGGIMGGLALLRARKGIVLTTTLMATVIFVVVVALVLFLLFASISAQAPGTGGSFFYGIFDAIIKMVSG